MTDPRSTEARIDWFLGNNPSSSGMCAQHTWHSLGGDYGNPPAWGCPDANACVDKVRASGRYWTPDTWDGPPPRGAWVGYKYGSNGHACLSLGDGRIATTDPNGGPGKTGIESLDYPNKWGASGWDVWTDQYAGVRFEVDAVDHGAVYLSKLVYGQMDSDSVRRLQLHLNDHPLTNGSTLPITGNLLDQTAAEIRLCRDQHGFTTSIGDEFVSQAQADHIFAGWVCGCSLINDTVPVPPDPEPEPPDPVGVVNQFGLWKWYSGKLSSDFRVYPDGDWHRLDSAFTQPSSGIKDESEELHFLYLRLELPDPRSAARFFQARFIRSDGDATAYHGQYYGAEPVNSVPFYDFHMESGSGIGGHWEVRVSGGTDPVTITTRYAKTAVFYVDDVLVTLDRIRQFLGL